MAPRVRSHLKEAVRLGWGGAKVNFLPAMMLWSLGLALILAYSFLPPFTNAMDQVGRWKVAWSPWFAIISTALFGSLIPWLVQGALVRGGDRQPFRHIPLLMLYWALQGWEVDWLYRIQAMIFGSGSDLITIAQKTLVDQFVWVPLLGAPQTMLAYLFIEKGCSFAACREALKRKSFLERVIPLIIATWVVWIPAVSLVYLFPLSLQLPLMNMILALWCLILAFFARNADGGSQD